MTTTFTGNTQMEMRAASYIGFAASTRKEGGARVFTLTLPLLKRGDFRFFSFIIPGSGRVEPAPACEIYPQARLPEPPHPFRSGALFGLSDIQTTYERPAQEGIGDEEV